MKAVSETPWRSTLLPEAATSTTRLLQPVQQDREVVRREVADDAVAVVLAEVHARGGDEVHVPDDAAVDQLAHRVDGGAVDEGVARHQHAVAGGGEVGELVGVRQPRGERLLDEHVLAGLQRALGERVVGLRGRGDHDGLDRRVDEHARRAR